MTTPLKTSARPKVKPKVPRPAPVMDTPPAPPKVFRVLPPPAAVTSARFNARASTAGITVHCAATRPSQNFDAAWLDRVHRNQGWTAVGYHFIIRRDGTVEAGRPIHAIGSHCRDGNRNRTHVGICLIGGVSERPQVHVPGNPWNGSDAECNFTAAQMVALKDTIAHIEKHYGRKLPVEGHRDVPGVRKACPSFVVSKWLKTGVASLN